MTMCMYVPIHTYNIHQKKLTPPTPHPSNPHPFNHPPQHEELREHRVPGPRSRAGGRAGGCVVGGGGQGGGPFVVIAVVVSGGERGGWCGLVCGELITNMTRAARPACLSATDLDRSPPNCLSYHIISHHIISGAGGGSGSRGVRCYAPRTTTSHGRGRGRV